MHATWRWVRVRVRVRVRVSVRVSVRARVRVRVDPSLDLSPSPSPSRADIHARTCALHPAHAHDRARAVARCALVGKPVLCRGWQSEVLSRYHPTLR